MHSLASTYRTYIKNRAFVQSTTLGLFLFVVSLFINYYAGTEATEKISSPVTDIILSNTRVHDVRIIFVYGPVILWCFVWSICLLQPRRLPFVLKSVALFILIRSIFISLTHIGPFPSALVIESHILKDFTFGGDLFFSGHTGIPFLLALIFWRNIVLRLIFLASSALFATVVLLGHLHYSIDVLSAFFITYTISHIASYFFPSDKKLFEKGLIEHNTHKTVA